jgi:HSP20 family molecular chaperone IbpA
MFQFDDSFFDEEDEFTMDNPILKIKEDKDADEKEELIFPELANPDKEIWNQNEDLYGELSVDVYQTEDNIMIQSMIAGVRPESLEITIGRDMVIIQGKREDTRKINDDQFFIKELYWGSFARTISLSQEIDPDLAEAVEKYGLLTLKLPKINKAKKTTIKVKSI